MKVDLDTLGNPDGYLARTLMGWKKRGAAAWNGDIPSALTTLADWLDARLIADAQATLIHNDFKLDNVILDPESLPPGRNRLGHGHARRSALGPSSYARLLGRSWRSRRHAGAEPDANCRTRFPKPRGDSQLLH